MNILRISQNVYQIGSCFIAKSGFLCINGSYVTWPEENWAAIPLREAYEVDKEIRPLFKTDTLEAAFDLARGVQELLAPASVEV